MVRSEIVAFLSIGKEKIKMPRSTIYISGKELDKTNQMTKNLGVVKKGKLLKVRVSGFIGYHDIWPTFKNIIKFYLKRIFMANNLSMEGGDDDD